MFLSVIIPVHNIQEYVEECIKSVLNQNDDDYEIILIENVSNDNSLTICKKYENHPKISLFSLQESGVSYARNFGIDNAKGKYIWFVDGDDIIAPDSIKSIKNSLKIFSYPDALLFGYSELIGDKKIDRKAYPYNGPIDKNTAINGLFDSNLWSGFIWNKIIKNSSGVLTTLKFPTEIHMIEDLTFLTKCFKQFNTFGVLNKNLYFYRKRKGSISNVFSEKKLSAFNAYEIILEELKASKDFDFARKVIYNAKVDFSRQILTHYYFNDFKSYKAKRNKYRKIILKNFKHITHLKAKVAALITIISPKISQKIRKHYEK